MPGLSKWPTAPAWSSLSLIGPPSGPPPARVCVQEIDGYQRPLDIGEVPPLFARVGMATGDNAGLSAAQTAAWTDRCTRSYGQVRFELCLNAQGGVFLLVVPASAGFGLGR
ncbi:unnamed protein product [Ixodes persulcatus]